MVKDGAEAEAANRRNSGERLSSQISRLIRELILSGEAPGGSKLRTEHLAVRFGVSATPVREALMTLHGEGLVAFQPGRGFTVIPITRGDFLDLFAAQAYLTGELTARAAVQMTTAQLDELWVVQGNLVEAIDKHDHATAERVEFEFHQMVNHITDAPKLRWLLKSTTSYAPFHTWFDVPGWAQAAPEDHLPLLRALGHRSENGARAAMVAHITNVAEMLADLLAERGVLTDSASPIT